MTRGHRFLRDFIAITLLASGPAILAAHGADGVTIAHNTPRFVSRATNAGAVNPGTVMDVSIWLKPHNKAELDALAKNLYNPSSVSYRKWLTKAEFAEKFAPTAAEAATVEHFLSSNGLKVSKVGPNNFFVRATGTAAEVSKAFKVTLNNYVVNGKTIRANAEDPYVSGAAGALVNSVAGLDSAEYVHPVLKATTMRKPPAAPSGGSKASKAVGEEAASGVTAASKLPASAFNAVCFPGPTTESFTTDGGLPKATYTGNEYTTNSAGCGYTPANIQTAYNLTGLYKEKLDGTGQTIAIIDWCGSPTITADANAFSAQFGLPKLTAANFQIIPTGVSYCAAPDPEINIDVEWAHAIAPGASIDLVVPPTASFQDVDEGFFYAVNYGLGNNISGSYGSEELYTSTSVLITEDLISEIAAVEGISANFSTGDEGDFTFDDPLYFEASVSAPADSPYATGVGGISLSLKSNSSISWQSGWGTNANLLSDEGYVLDPPGEDGFFNFGSGGGASGFFLKPYYQENLPGAYRQLPDVSWLADPYTGAYIAISEPGVVPETQYVVYGGTSLACPMFSGLWAIANQAAGFPLGQAAPYMYTLPASTLYDIVPYGGKSNVTGYVTDYSGTTKYTANELADPLEGTTTYFSAIWNYPLTEDTAYLLTFGTDSSLMTTPGWDNVTGVGVPKAKAFVDYFKP